jgi:CheY-like chemotaxis protein
MIIIVIILLLFVSIVFYIEKKKKKQTHEIKVAPTINIVEEFSTPEHEEKKEDKTTHLGMWVEDVEYDDAHDHIYEKIHQNISEIDNDSTDSKLAFVLVVDDSLVVRKKIKDLLLTNNYNVITKNDGQEAFNYLNSGSLLPDLIISDIEMPVMNGIELLEKIKDNTHYSHIPILVVSAHAENHIELMEQELINGFITKPFVDSDLISQVKYLTHHLN